MKALDDLRRSLGRTRQKAELRESASLTPLQKEYELFEANRIRWAAEGHTGEFVLIRDGGIEFFPTLREAYEAGLKKFGRVDYFIRQVTRKGVVHTVPFWLEEHLQIGNP